jgi:PAS domain S-box-containing protein
MSLHRVEVHSNNAGPRPLAAEILTVLRVGDAAPAAGDVRSRIAARSLGMLAALIGLSVLGFRWGLDLDAFRRVLPTLLVMAPVTATCFALAGLSLAAATFDWSPSLARAGSVLGAAVAVIAVQALAEAAIGRDFGTDLLLFPDTVRTLAPDSPYPGRLSPLNAAALTALGTALALLRARRLWARRTAGGLALLGVAVGALALLGYVIGLDALYGGSERYPLTAIALHSAVEHLLLGGGILVLLSRELHRARDRTAWIAFALLFAVAGLLALGQDAAATSAAVARRSSDTRLLVETVLSALRDAETGQRGFLLTGDERYLEPYDAGRGRLGDALQRVEPLIVEVAGPPAAARIAAVRKLAGAKLAELAETLRLARAGQEGAALALVRTDEGKGTMDAIRAEAEALDAEATAASNAARRRADLSAHLAAGGALGMSLLACAALAVATAMRRRGAERERVAAGRLAAALDLAGAVVRRPDGTVLHWSAGMAGLYGWTAAETEGRRVHEVLRTEFPVPEAEIAAALARDGHWEGELVQHTCGGRRMVVAARWMLHPSLLDHGGAVVVETSADVSALRSAEARLRLAQRIGRIGHFDWDIVAGRALLSDEYRVLHGLPADEEAVDLARWLALLHPDDRGRAEAQMRASLETGTPLDTTLRIVQPLTGEIRWIATRAEVFRARDGRPRRMVGAAQDVTERMEAERRRDLIVRELNHRVKNTLATVQSLVAQTLRSAADEPARFGRDLGGRLQALARSHDLLTANDWVGVRLGPLVRAAMAPWLEVDTGRVAVTGRDGILLAPPQAQAMVMGLHELATNAGKHGALSAPDGQVAVAWQERPDGSVEFSWTESGGPPLAGPPAARGFGTRLLERGLARDLGPDAEVILEFAPQGVAATIRFSPRCGSWVGEAVAEPPLRRAVAR